MADLPKTVSIKEEGPREGFQIEKGPITAARKVELIDALSKTGVKHIQIVSFVNPKVVPQMVDAEDVVKGLTMQPGVSYTGLWFNDQGLDRAIGTGRLDIKGTVSLTASAKFLKKNLNRTPEQQVAATRGTSYGTPSPGEVDLAEEICARVAPVEQVRLVNSGTEATMSAVRLARGLASRT